MIPEHCSRMEHQTLRDHETRGPGQENAPSRTGQVVALTRAQLTRPHSPAGDPDAQRRLCRGMRPLDTSPLRPSLIARTRFFDGRVLAAISAGARQVVILGAGYDDRALRFRSPGVRFFELDHPATQADKRRRLQALRVSPDEPILAPADFRHDDVAAVLEASGHDAGQPTLFLCEGLLVYLDSSACVRLLSAVRSRAAAGSELVVSLATHREGVDSAHAVAIANSRRPNVDEPWLTILPPAAHLELLGQAGWQVGESVDAAALGTGAEPGRSLLVTAGAPDTGKLRTGFGSPPGR
jgi:methyltransferase (TIGR00027 family)